MLATGLGLSACVSLDTPPPRIKKPPPEQSAKDTGLFAVGGRTTVDFPRADGTTALSATGQISALMGAAGGTGDLLDIEASSRLPEYDSQLAAGRLRYELGRQVITLDHRLDVRSASHRATMRAERGEFNTETLEFVIAGRARFTYDGTMLFIRGAHAKYDLRSAGGVDLWARRASDSGTWTARAKRGDVDASGCIVFAEVTGDMAVGGKPATFEAPRAAWHGKDGQLNFENGVTITLDGAKLHAEAATYEMASRRVTTRGATTLARDGLSVAGTGGTVDLAARQARLNGINAQMNGDHLRADTGTVGDDRTLRLSGVNATLADGTTLNAGTATYRDKAMTASGGVRVTKDGSSFSANTATRSASGALTASGGVRLSRDSYWVRGDRLTADRGLTSATMSPLRAGGQGDEGAWTISASSGRAGRGDGLSMESPSGVFHGRDRRASASAGHATLSPDAKLVTFSGGFRLTSPSDGLTVTANGGTFDTKAKTFRLTGDVHADVQGAKVTGRSWVYRLGRGEGEPVVETGR
ncbi:MAG: LPS export ABC transporter periplasmic protein LptC [Armatimonadetes bacterium]|nr:LPS export ABC transporter periplasmic protein LptC [Armatimonadota bacterium]